MAPRVAPAGQQDCDDLALDLAVPLEDVHAGRPPDPGLDLIIFPPPKLDVESSGGRLSNEDAQYHIRKRYISDKLRERAPSFTRYRGVSVFCGTYNVNGKKDDEDLSPWLQPGRCPDVYAVGFQEIVELNAVNVTVDSKSLQRAAFWRARVEACLLCAPKPYALVAQQHLVGILLLVYVRQDAAGAVDDVQVVTPTVGVMGVLGNKGAVCVRLQFHLSTFCFVCSHLAASRNNVAGRNADFRNILLKASFAGDPETAWEFRGLASEYSGGRAADALSITDHDVVFWIGDLNYRISEYVSIEEVFDRMATPEGLDWLRARDQLLLERRRGAVFQNFEEGEITFPPTYKYQPGTSQYERRPDKKLRAPAWCDRVLWSSREDPGHVRLESYCRAELLLSDHKPVAAAATVQVRLVDSGARLRAFADVKNGISCWGNGGAGAGGAPAPAISLGQSSVDLGDIDYMADAVGVLRVANVGRTLAYLRFVPKAGDRLPWRRWLHVSPPFALLTPGDRVEFTVAARVDRRLAMELAAGTDALNDVLVLRLENGPAFYVAVSGRYVGAPCFGAPLHDPPLRRQPAMAGFAAAAAPAMGVPPELWRLVDGLVASGALTDPEVARDLFVVAAPAADGERVRAALGSGAPFPASAPPLALADTLLLLLSSLPVAMVPPEAVAAAGAESAGRLAAGWHGRFLGTLPPAHANVFLYVVCFLREVVAAWRSFGLPFRSGVSAVAEAMCFSAVAAAAASGGAGVGAAGIGLGVPSSGAAAVVANSAGKDDETEPSQWYLEAFKNILMHFLAA